MNLLKFSSRIAMALLGPISLAEQVPSSVDQYFAQVERSTTGHAAGSGSSVSFQFKPLYWHPANGYAGNSVAWIVGAQVAQEKRHKYYVTSILDEQGRPLLEMGEPALSGENGFALNVTEVSNARFIAIDPQEHILASSLDSGDPRRAGKLEIVSLSPTRRKILLDLGGMDRKGTSYAWDGAYYFRDFDLDGRIDVLVNRRVSWEEETTSQYQNQKFLFKLDPVTLTVRDVTSLYLDRIGKIFSETKADPNVPVVYQVGPVKDLASLSGEPIYPSEAKSLKVDFAASEMPRLATTPFLPEGVVASTIPEKPTPETSEIPSVSEAESGDGEPALEPAADRGVIQRDRLERIRKVAIGAGILLLVGVIGCFVRRKK